ncbi:CBS domain-containing protein [Streptomyces showdoensis]|uniref:CBS domain-containing protein n=1 Tax=Streptomyces showdoensis TaxID=68268 RepID=A0A2P2GVB0_STREW|nr:CBS domain-containing protein [Streptomyces showdoensis]KKZ75421.1 CBS domain-containing protein [Streptomyces showdoensis]
MTSKPYTVADVMTRRVVAVLPGADFKEIVTTMRRWRVTAVPVVEGEGRVVGVVSEADLLLKEEFHDHRLGLVEQMRHLDATAKAGSRRARELMTSPAVTVSPGASLPAAARLMTVRGVKRLPVVDAGGVLRGVVSRSDLLKVFLRPDEDLAAEVRHDVVEPLFPLSRHQVDVRRLARAVEGVVDVRCELAARTGA